LLSNYYIIIDPVFGHIRLLLLQNLYPMEPKTKEVYYKSILAAIEQYQRGEVNLEYLEKIPKEDLLSAMRMECQRISKISYERNKALAFNFKGNEINERDN
jgi:hypothetical protein